MISLDEQLHSEKLLPLYTVTRLDLLPVLEDVLLEHNIHFIEIAYRSDLATQAIKQLAASNKLIVGAGTVCTVETAKQAIDSGAQFIVMPGIHPDVVRYCQERNIPVYPGAVTPAEIVQAINLGLNVVKFFPANVYGGLTAIKNLAGPFPNIKFVPTGGIDENNFKEYIDNSSILAVGGSFIISEKILALDNGDTARKNLSTILSRK